MSPEPPSTSEWVVNGSNLNFGAIYPFTRANHRHTLLKCHPCRPQFPHWATNSRRACIIMCVGLFHSCHGFILIWLLKPPVILPTGTSCRLQQRKHSESGGHERCALLNVCLCSVSGCLTWVPGKLFLFECERGDGKCSMKIRFNSHACWVAPPPAPPPPAP